MHNDSKYMQHLPDCRVGSRADYQPQAAYGAACSCGLDELLRNHGPAPAPDAPAARASVLSSLREAAVHLTEARQQVYLQREKADSRIGHAQRCVDNAIAALRVPVEGER